MDQSRINAIRARCEAAEDNYKSVRANFELMELFHVDIPDLLAEVERLTRELEAAKRDMAISSMDCTTCKYADLAECLSPCCDCGNPEWGGSRENWQWRGATGDGGTHE